MKNNGVCAFLKKQKKTITVYVGDNEKNVFIGFFYFLFYLLCISQLLKVGQRGTLSLASSISLTEIHLVLASWAAQVEDSSCVG